MVYNYVQSDDEAQPSSELRRRETYETSLISKSPVEPSDDSVGPETYDN